MYNKYKQISPVVYVLEANEEKYYFTTKKKAKLKWVAMGNKAYKAPVKCLRFYNKQDFLNYLTGQNNGDINDNQSANRNNL